VDVVAEPPVALALEALRPAVERLARARPLRIHPTRAEFTAATGAGGLSVIGTGVEALVGRPADDAGAGNADTVALDRERLKRELASARTLLDAARARLANASFMSKAPPAVVAGARAREAELADQVRRLEERLGA